MTSARAIAVCLLVVIAGCGSPAPPGPSTTATGPADSPVATDSPRSTATPLPPSARNPWRSAEVIVAVDGSASPNRSFVGLVEAAVTYWNGPGRANATYPATFRVVPNATEPDVLVVLRDAVDCADRVDVLGCAPRLSAGSRPDRPVTVEVAAGFSDETTLRTIEHEFGHLLGIRHGEPPLPLMEPSYAAATLPATDAVDKPNPWTTADLRVWVDYANASADREVLEFQLGQAVAYYDAGAEGHVPGNTSFRLVEDRAAAVIVVRFGVDREGCSTDSPRSCGFRQGFDPDRDGELEYYTDATVLLNGLDAAATGWHLGYWLGVLMGHDRPEELAPPFRNASYEDRRSDWWE